MLVSSFIGLAYEGISSFLQWKHRNILYKAVIAMSNQANIQCNKLMKLDNTMLMYGIYNVETLEKLINTVHEIHDVTSHMKKYLQGNITHLCSGCLYTNALSIQQYAINSLLFLRIIQDKYKSQYRELITQLRIYVSAIRCLQKDIYLNTLLTPKKLQGILSVVKGSLPITNPVIP